MNKEDWSEERLGSESRLDPKQVQELLRDALAKRAPTKPKK